MAAATIPIILSRNIPRAPEITSNLKVAIPIPTVAKGGTRATAMAVPGSVADNSGFTLAKEVAIPAIIATNKYTRDGFILEIISGFKLVEKLFPEVKDHNSQVIKAEKPITKPIDFKRVMDDLDINLWSAVTTPRDSDKIGDKIGAINMEAITIEVLFINKPQAAINPDIITKKKKEGLGVESSIRDLMAPVLSFSVMLSNSKFIFDIIYFLEF